MLRLRALCTAICVTAAIAVVGAGSAFAGEVTGSGNYIAGSDNAPLKGKSSCAYSGLNDNYVFGNPLPDADGFTTSQSYGQVVRQLPVKGQGTGVPGQACNPTAGGGE
jgi:hypothetical protein